MFYAAPDKRKIKNVKMILTPLVGNVKCFYNHPKALRDRNGKLKFSVCRVFRLLNFLFVSCFISSADFSNVENEENDEVPCRSLNVLLKFLLKCLKLQVEVNEAKEVNEVMEVIEVSENVLSMSMSVVTFVWILQACLVKRGEIETEILKLFCSRVLRFLSWSYVVGANMVDEVDEVDEVHVSKVVVTIKHSLRSITRWWFCDPNLSFLLQMCGDVELNPGPVPDPGPDHTLPGTDSRERQPVQEIREEDIEGRVCEGRVCDVQIVSLNVRGLSDPKKVRHLVNKCFKLSKRGKDNIFFFQETFVQNLNLLDYIWRGEHHLTPGTGNSLGCLTLVTSPFKIIHRVNIGQRGHILALTKNDVNQIDSIIANIYAPNGFDNEKLEFFTEVLEKIKEVRESFNCQKVILAGDLNVVLRDSEVINRLISTSERRVAAAVKNVLIELDMVDGWSESTNKSYTWSTNRNGVQSFSTLDRICYTKSSLALQVVKTDWGLSVSDHAAVIASLNNKNLNSDRSKSVFIPRLDNRLLEEPKGRELLTSNFVELLAQADVNWNPHVRLEHCKMCLRTAANMATGKIKAELRDEEVVINADINSIIDELSNGELQIGRKELLIHKLDDLRRLKRSLITKIGTRLEQRTCRKWYNEGELSNKYFFGLLNRKANDEVDVLVNDEGKEVTEKSEIEIELRNFYKSLYESVPEEINLTNDFFANVNPVHPDQAATITMDLTLDELAATLQTCKDSAPGPDGIPYSYLRYFWQDIGPILLKAWQYSLTMGNLPPSHKMSYLRLIPKTGKDPRIISNLRPITLSNTDHKLITKTYARKLTKVVDCEISQEQTAYVPGRLINDNIRSMLMTIDLANLDNEVDGALISLDARKAFDSVDHRYIRECLRAFGLSNFIPVFNTLYKDLKSNIIVNGKVIDGYSILKGVKQGDALSCILFIMCIEPLIRNIKNNPSIEPITSKLFGGVQMPKIYGFADDINALVKRNGSVNLIFAEYEKFSENSGLILNANKTEIMSFNYRNETIMRYDFRYMGKDHVINSQEQIKINGILFRQEPQSREKVNVEKVVASMENLLRSWSTRRLTLFGRILIIKTYAISQLIFLMQSMTLSEASKRTAVKVIYKFLWNKNFDALKAPERLKRSIMLTPVDMGGFGLLDLDELGDSLDLRSYGRLINSRHPLLSQLAGMINDDDFFDVSINAPVDNKLLRSISLLNRERRLMLQWPKDNLLTNLNFVAAVNKMRLTNILTPQGTRSISYFMIHRRQRNVKVEQVTLGELASIERFFKYPNLAPLVRDLLTTQLQLPNRGTISSNELYPIRKRKTLVSIASLSSKDLRLNNKDREEGLICIYKQGLILTPGEVLNWTKGIRKLTSTRHKNIILRTAHGDIYSNERLSRFGLLDSPRCGNCPEPCETIRHRLVECPKANEVWRQLNEVKNKLGLRPLSDFTIENLLGAKDRINKVELALNAEALHKLATIGGKEYCVTQLVKSIIKVISICEPLTIELKQKFKEINRNG